MEKKYHTGGTVPKYNWKIKVRDEIETRAQIYMTTHIPGLVQVLQ
jgi:hypothetical protein